MKILDNFKKAVRKDSFSLSPTDINMDLQEPSGVENIQNNVVIQNEGKEQEIVFEPIPDKDYSEPDFVLTAMASSKLPITYTASGACTVTGDTVHILRAGQCIITAHQDGDNSFGTAQDVTRNFAVRPAQLTVKADDKVCVYGDKLPRFSASISGLVSGLEPLGKIDFETVATPGSPAGSYPILPNGLTSPNYTYTYIPGTLTISLAPLTVKADDKSKVYGSRLPDFSATASGLVNGDTLNSLGNLDFQTTTGESSAVGVYPIEPQGLVSTNYAITYLEGSLNITPASLTIKVDDKNVVYGEPLPEFTSTVTGLLNGDKIQSLGELSFKTVAKQGSGVGAYAIVAGGLASPNYEYEYVEGLLNITPASLIVKADDKSAVVGEELPAFNATATGLVNGDVLESLGTLSLNTTATRNSPPGKYSITPYGLSVSNYEITYSDGTLVIDSNPPEGKNENNRQVLSLTVRSKNDPRLGELLVGEGMITSQELISVLSKQLGVPPADFNSYQIEREALRLVPEHSARKFNLIPVCVRDEYLTVAMADPTDIIAIETLTAMTKKRIKPMIASEEEIQKAIDRSYKSLGELEKHLDDIKPAEDKKNVIDESISEAPAVKALDIIVEEAIKNRASDIHIEPQTDRIRLRFRIDGVMQEVSFLPIAAHGQLMSRLKVLANMNIADHRPQDGQFNFKAWDKDVDVRVATIATAYGEMGTLRILDKSFAVRTLQNIGFSPRNLEQYQKMLKSPFGMVLISGPTGSGKTTTLYASINSLNCKELKIITIEDPVEYHFDGVNQIQVNPRGGITFSDGIRAIMRHDPDVALVGEIRDKDTASVAVQAAMTGHLVLASVHANDTVGVLFRLVDLGVEPFLLASSLIGVVAQRMVRRVCPHCRQEVPSTIDYETAYREEVGESRKLFYRGKGCDLCANTGYLGRTAVMEILNVSDEIKRLLLTGASTAQIRAQATKEGTVSMRHDGMLKVKEGITTPDEVLRNVLSI